MGILPIIGLILDSVPLLRTVWRRVVERQLEIVVDGPVWRDGEREELKYTVAIEEPSSDESFKVTPFMFVMFTLRLINHRTDRKERVIGGYLAIKARRLFWRRTIATVAVHQRGSGQLIGPRITNLELEPMSPPTEVQCVVSGTLDEAVRDELPQRSEIWLVLDMVGPIRRLERKLQNLHRQPRVPQRPAPPPS